MNQSSPDRRQSSDRRNSAARRRHADARSIYLELCHSVLRVAIVIESDSEELPELRTRTVRWRNEAPDLMCDAGQAELAEGLRRLVTEERLAGCSVSLAISSTLCVNRATSGATAKVESEIAELKERSQLYLSLGPGPKTTAVGRKSIDARHEHALVTVTNERTLQRLIDAVESAGMVVDVVESALVALSRLQGRLEPDNDAPVILAQLDEEHFEIGVSRLGELLVEYRPASDATVERLGEVVDDHLDRLKRYCGKLYNMWSVPFERMWLVGKPAEVAATNSETKTGLATEVMPLDRLSEYWRLPDGSSITAEMGAALGLAFRARLTEQGACPNLMDEIHARAKPPIRPFLMRALAPIAATLLAAATLWLVNLEQQAEIAALRSKFEKARPAQLRGERLSHEIAKAGSEIDNLTRLVQSTPEQNLTPLVERLGGCLPGDVWLRSLREFEGKVSLEGNSYTESGVYDFVRHLQEAPSWGEVALRGTGVAQTPQGPATSFEVELQLPLATPATKASKP
ncbi:Fimbrial assembly protein (PilN) [Planctomycetes bacterium MalM25]|nr:Fimbrial assembly protein (PilN) [Planctomycetes bacterium MalM25]